MSDPVMATYRRQPQGFTRGEGIYLWDDSGQRYLDALSGIAVVGLGHCHPAVTRALQTQAETLVHTSNLYRVPLQERLAAKLCDVAGLDSAFFCNSGAEANEAAIKLARLYGHRKGLKRPVIAVAEGSFHGRTLATLSASGNRKIQAGFEPLVQGFVRVPYNDVAALQTAAENTPDIVAVMVEPIQGEGGVVVPDAEYLSQLRALCDQHGWLLILDEIQTGMGRTGRWFAHQHNGIRPDIMTLAKSLGNGFPIGACLATAAAAEAFGPGSHGSTFGGNPLGCAVALSVLETIDADDLVTRADVLGQRLIHALKTRLDQAPGVVSIRGQGLIVGIELDRPCGDLVAQAADQGVLINVTAERVIRLLPPLVATEDDMDRIAAVVSDLVLAFTGPAAR